MEAKKIIKIESIVLDKTIEIDHEQKYIGMPYDQFLEKICDEGKITEDQMKKLKNWQTEISVVKCPPGSFYF